MRQVHGGKVYEVFELGQNWGKHEFGVKKSDGFTYKVEYNSDFREVLSKQEVALYSDCPADGFRIILIEGVKPPEDVDA